MTPGTTTIGSRVVVVFAVALSVPAMQAPRGRQKSWTLLILSNVAWSNHGFSASA